MVNIVYDNDSNAKFTDILFSDCSALSYNMMKNNLKRGSVCYKPIFIKFLLFFPQRTGNTHKDTHKLFNSLHKTNKKSIILSHLFL